jgi:uncharacterized NAD(P)/FAD-binding protein YdhS
MQSIGIIGGGFAGIMTAVHLIQKSTQKIEIYIIGDKEHFARGIAYQPYSSKHILNVIAGKMSAFPDKPDDFLNWLIQKEDYQSIDRSIIANSFISRRLYGDYLCKIWRETLLIAHEKEIQVVEITDVVNQLNYVGNQIQLHFLASPSILINQCVIATGNQIPKNPAIANINFYKSLNYYQNPWKIDSVSHIKETLPILILGNGLTMVDTIIGLQEMRYGGDIISISPNGFNILPHRHSGVAYTAHLEEIKENMSLQNLVKVINKHIKIVRQFGLSAEPIIDALRPWNQKIWRGLSFDDKKLFMNRLRHLYGVARHRIPLHIYDKIQKLRIEGKLHIESGKIIDIVETAVGIEVKFYNKKTRLVEKSLVSRVINCTGPETDFSKLENSFLAHCIHDGFICQDELKLGIRTNIDNFKVKYKNGQEHNKLYALGSNLKGELWESTAVNELRQQAEALSMVLLNHINEESGIKQTKF